MLNENKVRFLGRDLNFAITLSTKNELAGLGESINSFIETETGLSINPASDGEKLKYLPISILTYTFYFYNSNTSTYGTSLLNAGFTHNELITLSESLKKSFYLFQVYNSTVSDSQILLHSGYFNGFTFLSGNTTYTITPDAEISGYYIANDQLSNVITNNVYLKLSFFNAKTGKLQLFLNDAKIGSPLEDKFYFDATINSNDLIYSLSSPLIATEFINTEYINKLNENVPSFSYEKPSYPTGGTSLSGNTYFNP